VLGSVTANSWDRFHHQLDDCRKSCPPTAIAKSFGVLRDGEFDQAIAATAVNVIPPLRSPAMHFLAAIH